MKEELTDILFSESIEGNAPYINVIPDTRYEFILTKLEEFINIREKEDKELIKQSRALIESLLAQQIVIRNINSGYEKVYDIAKEMGIIVNWNYVNKVTNENRQN